MTTNKSINIHEAKTNFSKLINAALNGEEITICKNSIPVAKLIPYSEKLPERHGGQFKDIMKIAADFDATLPKDYLDAFYSPED